MAEYPDDADGAVLSRLAAHGIDMTQPLLIEFFVAVPDESSANAGLQALFAAGYESYIEYDAGEPGQAEATGSEDLEFGPSWTIVANVCMAPHYTEIVRIQAELDGLVRPHGGNSDGWGVLLDGNSGS